VQFGQYPAKWQTDPTRPPSCTTDYVIFALNVPGVTGGQPSIVGLNKLYSSPNNSLCNAQQPNFLFSYNTNTTSAAAQGHILTSPVLSLDGKKVAFIETSTVAGQRTSVLHVLKIPTTGNQVTPTPASLPPAGAMLSATIGGASNTRSSPGSTTSPTLRMSDSIMAACSKSPVSSEGHPLLPARRGPLSLVQVFNSAAQSLILIPEVFLLAHKAARFLPSM
jgi:hypothetical protein